MNPSTPIETSQSTGCGRHLLPLLFSIPEFEGQTMLRVFGNSTRSETACYSAVITNGATFSHLNTVGPILGIITPAALAASFITTAYVDSPITTWTHCARSLSVFVVYAAWQRMFFTGSLSLNWPSVFVAFWSNFAWCGVAA